MGGHSHWKGIKEKKGALDKKRAKLFAKLLRAIEISARQGDANPDNNPTLADAIQRAKDGSVPKDNIERAVARGSGTGADATKYETVVYEAYGPGGVAMLIEALTDNRNRTSQDLKAIFRRGGGSLAEPGAVQWQFERKGVILVDRGAAAEDDLMTAALDHADDVTASGDEWEVVTAPPAYEQAKAAIAAAGIPILSAEITQRAQNTVPVAGNDARAVLKLMESLEDHDDVQAVFANFDIPDEVLAEVS
jgi:YebC/PmpR family DNA-binding regulatory protein